MDFAMVAAFIGMVIPYLNNKPSYVAVLVSGCSAMAFNGLPHQLGLIVASLLGMVSGVFAESLMAGRARRTAGSAEEK